MGNSVKNCKTDIPATERGKKIKFTKVPYSETTQLIKYQEDIKSS